MFHEPFFFPRFEKFQSFLAGAGIMLNANYITGANTATLYNFQSRYQYVSHVLYIDVSQTQFQYSTNF